MNKTRIQTVISATLISFAFGNVSISTAEAKDLQDVFSYQAANNAVEADFIQSNVEGLFEGQKIQKSFSDQFSFEMTRLKSAHKEFDLDHRNILESSTRIDFSYADVWYSRIQLGNSRQDVYSFANDLESAHNNQRTYSFTQGWKKDFQHDLIVETYLGLVQSTDQNVNEEKYYPVFGLKLKKDFENNAEITIHAAQEVQAGGSYTGMYGNQVFRKLMVMGRISLIKKLSFLWDAGVGLSQGSFDQKGFSLDAGVATVSASVEYGLGKNVKGLLGYSHRNLMDQSGFGTEGHMMSASFSFANF